MMTMKVAKSMQECLFFILIHSTDDQFIIADNPTFSSLIF